MANTAAVYARIDPKLKSEVETILARLGVTPSSLIQMLYNQILLTNGIPFEVRIPKKPKYIDDMTEEELRAEIEKGLEDVRAGRVVSAEEVGEWIKNVFSTPTP